MLKCYAVCTVIEYNKIHSTLQCFLQSVCVCVCLWLHVQSVVAVVTVYAHYHVNKAHLLSISIPRPPTLFSHPY